MGQHSGLHCPGAYTAKTTTLHAEASSTARVIASTAALRQQNAKLRDRQRRPIRLRCMHDAMPTLRCLQPSLLATALHPCMRTVGRGACIAGEAGLRETLSVHNCMRARAPANDVTLPMTPASLRCLHRRPANGGARTHDAMNAMHTSSACDAKIAQPALHGICMRCMHTCKGQSLIFGER